MQFEMIAVKCKHWNQPTCPNKDKNLLANLLLGLGVYITTTDIVKADNICRPCKSFEQYRVR